MNQISDDIQKDYKNLAKDYENRWEGFAQPARTWLLKQLNYPRDMPLRVLDLGCGTGECLSLIAHKYPKSELSGYDLSADMLVLAKDKLPNVTLTEANLEILELQKKQYDAVVNFYVLHHITDPSKFLEKIVKTTKVGGDIFIVDYAIDNVLMLIGELFWRLFLPSHYKAYSSKRLRAMLEGRKYIEIIESKKFSSNWFWRQQAYHLRRL